jgi:pilus assembly protein CpaD
MFQIMKSRNLNRLLPVAIAGVLLAGCQLDSALQSDYEPATVAERYPIQVRQATFKTGLRAPTGQLNTNQTNAVADFAIEAKRTGSPRVQILYPGGASASRKLANEIAVAITNYGIPKNRISVKPIRGGANEPIQLVLTRKVAITKECGDWSEDLASTHANTVHPNYGCAMQHNIAAMVANPEDLERPRAMGPVLAGNRTETMKIFVENSTTGDYWTIDGDSKSP